MTTIRGTHESTMTARSERSDQDSRASALTAAIDFRDVLLASGWPDETQLVEQMKLPGGADARRAISLMRRSGMLFGVWSARRGCILYPDFQFCDYGLPIPEVSLLLQILPAEGDDGGWRRAFWLYSPHALLDGSAPSTIFALDPARILEVAKVEFNASPDSNW